MLPHHATSHRPRNRLGRSTSMVDRPTEAYYYFLPTYALIRNCTSWKQKKHTIYFLWRVCTILKKISCDTQNRQDILDVVEVTVELLHTPFQMKYSLLETRRFNISTCLCGLGHNDWCFTLFFDWHPETCSQRIISGREFIVCQHFSL